jgi:hypothetical protein
VKEKVFWLEIWTNQKQHCGKDILFVIEDQGMVATLIGTISEEDARLASKRKFMGSIWTK